MPFIVACLEHFARTYEPSTASVVCERLRGLHTLVECRASAPLKLLSAPPTEKSAVVYVSSLGGGLVSGDQISLELRVASNASLVVTSQASGKVYRSTKTTGQSVSAIIEPHGFLCYWPEITVPFAHAVLKQKLSFSVGEHARLLMIDILSSGRRLSGERWAFDRMDCTLHVRYRDSVVVFDRLLLDATHGALPTRMHTLDTVANVVAIGVDMPTLLLKSGGLFEASQGFENHEAEPSNSATSKRPQCLWATTTLAGCSGFFTRLMASSAFSLEQKLVDAFAPTLAGCASNPWEHKR